MFTPKAMRLGLAALIASLALAGTAHAATAHLSMARGYKAASRYALRDVRNGDATGYHVYGCHYHGREVVCAADEYGVVSPDLGVGTWFGMRIVATARPHGWISVRENRNVITPPFRTR